MGLRPMRGKWQYRFRIHGQDVCEMTGLAATERNRKRAEQMEAAHRQGIMEGRLGIRPLQPMSFEDAQEPFLKWCRTEYPKENSWRRIKTSMSSAAAFFGKTMVSMIHPGQIEAYKVMRLTDHKVKPVTCKHDLDNLSIFYGWAVKNNLARTNPVKDVSRPSDADAVRQHVLSAAEEAKYFGVASGNLYKVARLIILQGCRPEEVLRIRKEDVDLQEGLLHIRKGKTKAAKRKLSLTQEAIGILAGQMVGSSQWVFPSQKKVGRPITKLNNPHNRVLAKTGLSFVLYDLRHTFATRLAQSGADAFAIAAILGHSGTRVLSRYIHPTQAHQDAAMAVYNETVEKSRPNLTVN